MKITYYTALDWWGDAEAKKVTPKGYDYEIIKLEEALPYIQISNGVMFRLTCLLKGWAKDSHPDYVGDYNKWKGVRGDEKYRGQSSKWWGSKISYTRSFIKKGGYVYLKDGDETANWCSKSKKGARPQWIYTPQHENLHVKSRDLDKDDKLHEWIGLGKYDQYESDYLDFSPMGFQPLVERLAKEFIRHAKTIGLDLRITSDYRSFIEQDNLYQQGRMTGNSKPIVTNAKGGESFHNYGVAFDIVDRKKGYDISDDDWQTLRFIWRYITKQETGYFGEWGGDFKSINDRPHFQLTLGYKLKDFQNNKVDYSKFH